MSSSVWTPTPIPSPQGGGEERAASACRLQTFPGAAAAFAEAAEQVLASGAVAQIDSADIERALTAAMKLYAAKAEAEAAPPPPVSADRLTPTEAVVVISETMRAVNLNLFDLSMWYRRGERL
jgi:hypothetical protein